MSEHLMPAEPRSGESASVPSSPTESTCRKCSGRVDATMKFCPHCGQKQDTTGAWYYHPGWVLFLAFFALGPFALILVWKSPAMSRTFKLFMAALILVYTVYCVYFTYKLVLIEINQLNELRAVMGSIHVNSPPR